MTLYSAAETTFDQLMSKIHQHQARVGIIGLGYVGLPLALLYSEQRFPVTGFDVDTRKVGTLNQGGSYIYRITVAEIQGARAQGFSATSDLPIRRQRPEIRPADEMQRVEGFRKI